MLMLLMYRGRLPAESRQSVDDRIARQYIFAALDEFVIRVQDDLVKVFLEDSFCQCLVIAGDRILPQIERCFGRVPGEFVVSQIAQ